MSWIQTYTGRAFPVRGCAASDVSLPDIAHALANLCRFGGHCRRYYSVAEHSVHVSRLVPPELARQALMHDATEAYVLDLPAPVKSLVPGYRSLEQGVWLAVAERFRLPVDLHEEVKRADIRMLATEAEHLMISPPPHPWQATLGHEPYTLKELGLPHSGRLGLRPMLAKEAFLERFAELSA